MLGKRKIVALAMAKGSITAVEAVAVNGSGRIRRWAEFPLPAADDLRQPAALGRALKRFLGDEGFSASHCVIGLAAGVVTARVLSLPPADEQALPQMLALMVEREFGGEHKDLAVDYLADGGADGNRSALLVAAPRKVLGDLAATAQAAGLTVEGVTPSALALCGAEGSTARSRLMLHVFADGAEIAFASNGSVRLLRPLSAPVETGRSPAQWLGALADELYRVVALLPPEGTLGADASRELLIWDEHCLDEADRDELSVRLGLPAVLCRQADPEPADHRPLRPGAQFSAAAIMALDAVGGQPRRIDLLHSRLAPARKAGRGRKAAWGGAAAAAAVIAVGLLLLDWRSNRIQATRLEAELAGMKTQVTEARNVVSKVGYAREWFDRRPSYLDTLLDLAGAFPQEGTIWATGVTVKEDMRVGLSGKAKSKSAVLDLLDRLRANPGLADVKQEYIQQSGRSVEEVAFAMSFTCLDASKK